MTNLSKEDRRDIEDRLERREAIALNLAEQLNRKIDECQRLKREISILRGYVDALNARLDVEQ